MRRWTVCESCDGSGVEEVFYAGEDHEETGTCQECLGKGIVEDFCRCDDGVE